jgi:hypothetical protein
LRKRTCESADITGGSVRGHGVLWANPFGRF